jgi:hypothetical protein
VLGEDLKLVLGQQDRLERGSDTWANPVSYDKLGECLRMPAAERLVAAAGRLVGDTSPVGAAGPSAI